MISSSPNSSLLPNVKTKMEMAIMLLVQIAHRVMTVMITTLTFIQVPKKYVITKTITVMAKRMKSFAVRIAAPLT